jgi:hypothetical protein
MQNLQISFFLVKNWVCIGIALYISINRNGIPTIQLILNEKLSIVLKKYHTNEVKISPAIFLE